MPPTVKDIPKRCEVCSTTEVDKFTTCIYNICKECRNAKFEKSHLCGTCGEIEPDMFEKGRYTTCKKCRSNAKKLVKYIENKEVKPSNPDVISQFDKYIKFNHEVFGGLSLKQTIDNLNLSDKSKTEEIIQLRNKNYMLENEYFKVACELNEVRNSIKEEKFKNNFNDKYNELTEENRKLKEEMNEIRLILQRNKLT